jgi:hypothetical protein
MAGKITGIHCPMCDRMEQGKTESRLINDMSGKYICTAIGHKFPNYLELMKLKPRMDKLQVMEKQPPGSNSQQFWIDPDALAAIRDRFPTNFMTTIYSLFTALADPDTIVIEGEHMKELRGLGINRGRDVVGLAKTHKAMADQLETMTREMEQYKMIANLLKIAGGGAAMTGGMGPGIGDLTAALTGNAPAPIPPHAPVMPIIDTESDALYYEPVEAGSFGDSSLVRPNRNQVVVLGRGPAQ